MKINDFFQEAFYINLDKRPERRESFEKEMARVGLQGFVKRFSASVDATNLGKDDYNRHRACGKSHYNLISYAKNNNLKNILIFEDDAYFYDNGETPGLQIIESALDSLSEVPYWDLFYLGGLLIDTHFQRVDKHLAKANTILTAHAWAINHTAYDKLLTYIPETDSAIDGWVGQRHEIIKYIAHPIAVPQNEGKSDLDANGFNAGVGPYLESYRKPII
jgi:GR25 family glycosyltransferase involved in LPS biosynthesis